MAAGQGPGVTVRGIAVDSIRGRPLSGAIVQLTGTARSAVADSAGRFVFDSVAPGAYRLILFHERLDSIGLPGIVAELRIPGARDTITLAIPSFRTFWHAVCGSGSPPVDTGFVHGNVRQVAGGVLDSASITLRWDQLDYDKAKGFVQREWNAQIESDRTGAYTICGVPTQTPLRLTVVKAGFESAYADIMLDSGLIQRQDFRIASLDARPGFIRGVAYDAQGHPRPGARVVVDSTEAGTTDRQGAFFIPNVRPGTRNVGAFAVGAEPSSTRVDVQPGDTTEVSFRFSQLTVLAAVDVKAMTSVRDRWAQQMEERRAKDIGLFIDSTTLLRYPSPIKALSMQTMIGHVCAIFIDGIQLLDRPPGQAFRDFDGRNAKDYAMVEVQKGPQIPMEFRGRCQVSSTSLVVLAWTKLGR